MPTQIKLDIPRSGNDVPRLDDYFGEWAILEMPLLAMVETLQTFDLQLHIQNADPATVANAGRDFEFADGIATIRLSGPMMKQRSSLGGGASTVAARRQIRTASQDPDVAGIMIVIDSPGGTAAGTADLADAIRSANELKPTWAFIEDMGASAAYWAASAAGKIGTNSTAIVGSIGTFAVVRDMSKAFAEAGITVHVIRAGEFKGTGTPGTELTEEQLAQLQSRIDSLNGLFIDAVASGRSFSREQTVKLADGGVHIGAAAVRLGLTDEVTSQAAFVAKLKAFAAIGQLTAESVASETPEPKGETMTEKVAATAEQIEKLCVGANDSFVLSQLKAGASTDEAMAAYIEKQAADRATLETSHREDLAQAKADLTGQGIAAVTPETTDIAGETAAGDARAKFNELVDAKIAAGADKMAAVSQVVAARPDLHKAMIVSHNKKNGRDKALAVSNFA